MTAILFEILKLSFIDLLFLALLLVVIAPLVQYKKAAWAVLKRNFVGYFANPTGYVFLCLFVSLTSAAAFWPHDFFIANLANLDQLNKWMPIILLLFVPAITMSIWAEERRQGTDELLLTLPAADFDIVIGKYLAAVAIYTVSLLFAQFAHYGVLVLLATDFNAGIVDIDTGLFFTTYFGYWLMGLAMLSLGMVASFLTRNLTVSFILGMLFNALPVVTYYADVLVPSSMTVRQISQWSFASQFDDFGRGVISLSATTFFILLTGLGIYLSMVLIGKRHWLRHDAAPTNIGQQLLAIVGLCIAVPALVALILAPILVGRPSVIALWTGLIGAAVGLGLYWVAGSMARTPHSGSMAAHYTLRTLTLIVLLVGINSLFKRYDFLRFDLTQGQVSSLSADTKRLLAQLSKPPKAKGDKKAAPLRPIYVDAYISAEVPEEYVQARYALVAMLKEIQSNSGGRVRVNLRENLELHSDEAAQADQRFGIKTQSITTQSRGAYKETQFIMGVAFTCGLEKVVLPSFKLGMPVEYELVRSIATVAGESRKKVGIVKTDAEMMGGFSMAGMQPRPIEKQKIVEELERQYKVEEVDPSKTIEPGRYDVLLIVQPSSLGPQQLFNVVDAIQNGQPAAIFEDPAPMVMGQTVGTSMPKMGGGGMFGMGGQPQPKGDIAALWKALEIQTTGSAGDNGPPPGQVIWQNYNPYPRFGEELNPEFVFIRDDMPNNKAPFNREEPVVSHFEEVLFPSPTGLSQKIGAKLKYTPLVATSGSLSGSIDVMDLQSGMRDPAGLSQKRGNPSKEGYTLAAWIRSPQEVAVKLDGTTLTDGQKVAVSTPTGKPLEKTFTVANSGVATLTLTPLDKAKWPPGVTLVSNLGQTKLGAGQSTTFVVRLEGSKAGTFECPIAVASDDPKSPFQVTLSGSVGGDSASSGGEGEDPPAKKDEKANDEKAKDENAKGAKSSDAAAAKPALPPPPKPTGINVIYVGDIDVLSSEFVNLRNEPNRAPAKFHFDNVPFVCNVIDAVAGDDRFLEIRKHKPKHSTLRMVENQASAARDDERGKAKKAQEDFKKERDKSEAAAKQVYADLQKYVTEAQAKQARGEEVDRDELQAKLIDLKIRQDTIDKQLAATAERKQRELDQEIKTIERLRDQKIDSIQNNFKIMAVLPAFAPIFIGLIVWAYRTMREREGVSRTRMRS